MIHNPDPHPLEGIQPRSAPGEAVPLTGKTSSVDSEADEGEPLLIGQVLLSLDKALPEVKYSSYEGALKKQGFYYAENVLDFKSDHGYFVEHVGIPAGSVPAFLHHIEKEVSTFKHRHLNDGAAQFVSNENVAPTL